MTDHLTSKTIAWEFARYVNGRRMAEGIRITKAENDEQAFARAAQMAYSGDVLVLERSPGPPLTAETFYAAMDAAKRDAGPPIDVHASDDLPIEFVLDKVHELIFSKRREFFAYLEQCLRRSDGDNGESYRIAWPDGLLYLGREEFNAALRSVTKAAVELKPSEAASFHKTLARSPRRVADETPAAKRAIKHSTSCASNYCYPPTGEPYSCSCGAVSEEGSHE